MSDIELTASQKVAYEALMNGENVFLTGGAGTGKTTVINEYIKKVDPYCRHTILTAPTGKAALNLCIGGTYGSTIHKTFGLRKDILPKYKGNTPEILEHADRIVIDEISMARIDLFDYVAEALQDVVSMREMLGKSFQIILVGDFYQLPPVLPNKAEMGMSDKEILEKKYGKEVGKGYCFNSYAWEYLGIKTVKLTEIVRQKGDPGFCEALNQIRKGDSAGIKYINENCDHTKFEPDRVTICGRNIIAEKINKEMLRRNENKKKQYTWEIKTALKYPESILKSLPCDENVVLCEEARVICIANNPCAANGQTGTVKRLYSDSVVVEWDNGERNKVEAYEWDITKQELIQDPDDPNDFKIQTTSVLKVSQLPLKLAYAITVHKSQGSTLDKINVYMDLFEKGHLYTALSRCPSVKNIRLQRPLRPMDVQCDAAINKFYDKED